MRNGTFLSQPCTWWNTQTHVTLTRSGNLDWNAWCLEAQIGCRRWTGVPLGVLWGVRSFTKCWKETRMILRSLFIGVALCRRVWVAPWTENYGKSLSGALRAWMTRSCDNVGQATRTLMDRVLQKYEQNWSAVGRMQGHLSGTFLVGDVAKSSNDHFCFPFMCILKDELKTLQWWVSVWCLKNKKTIV